MIPHRTPRATLALLITTGLALAACSGGGDDEAAPTTAASPPRPTSTSTSTTTAPPRSPPTLPPPSTPAPVSTTIAPDILRMPLTGEPIAERRPRSRTGRRWRSRSTTVGSAIPQSGLNEADIVFEEIINDGLTRFAAVFHSQDADPVGPVRSGRYPDILMLEAFDRPLFVWSGGNAGVTYYIRAFQDGQPQRRRDQRLLPPLGQARRRSNLYTSTEAMWEKTPDDFSIPPVVLPYLRPGRRCSPATRPPIIDVTMDSNDVRWEYDPDTGMYYRWQDGKPAQHREQRPGDDRRTWS